MKRTQLYLDDESWQALHIRARQSGTSVSELVRQAVRERFVASRGSRRQAMRAFVGLWKDRSDLADVGTYLRSLRKGRRLKRLAR